MTHGIPPELVVEKKKGFPFHEKEAPLHTELPLRSLAGDFFLRVMSEFLSTPKSYHI